MKRLALLSVVTMMLASAIFAPVALALESGEVDVQSVTLGPGGSVTVTGSFQCVRGAAIFLVRRHQAEDERQRLPLRQRAEQRHMSDHWRYSVQVHRIWASHPGGWSTEAIPQGTGRGEHERANLYPRGLSLRASPG